LTESVINSIATSPNLPLGDGTDVDRSPIVAAAAINLTNGNDDGPPICMDQSNRTFMKKHSGYTSSSGSLVNVGDGVDGVLTNLNALSVDSDSLTNGDWPMRTSPGCSATSNGFSTNRNMTADRNGDMLMQGKVTVLSRTIKDNIA
jgi:hypothetical protein